MAPCCAAVGGGRVRNAWGAWGVRGGAACSLRRSFRRGGAPGGGGAAAARLAVVDDHVELVGEDVVDDVVHVDDVLVVELAHDCDLAQHLRAVGVRLTAAVEAVLHRAELHEQLAQRVLERIRRLGARVLRRRPSLDCGGQQRKGAARQLSAAQRLAPHTHEIGGRAHARCVEARPLRLALAALVRRREGGAHPLEVPAERRAEQRRARRQQREAAAALCRRARVQWLQAVELLRGGAEEGQQARLLEGQPRARVQRPRQAAGGGGAVRRAKLP